MSSMPLHVEMALDKKLHEMADIVGKEYKVTFIARNTERPHADITMSDDKSEKMREVIMSMDIEPATQQDQSAEGDATNERI